MKRKLFTVLTLILALLLPQSVLAWNATGHQLVAAIAWDNMTPTARRNVIALLQAAPRDACLLDMFPNDSRSMEVRQREFFMKTSIWADIVRPRDDDTRACVRFHRANWHYINYFWEGVSGATGEDAPQDREDIDIPEVNIVERLKLFRPFASCATSQEERATTLAWIVHMAGDIHQPLHTTARVTSRRNEQEGDQGGNLFKLGRSNNSPSLHSFWDGIINSSIQRQPDEVNNDLAYLNRVADRITRKHPRSEMNSRLRSGDFEAWSREGFETIKRSVYPRDLRRGQMPSDSYRARALATSEEAIALGGYRLADLLNQMFGQP
jgi:hypothetical protein